MDVENNVEVVVEADRVSKVVTLSVFSTTGLETGNADVDLELKESLVLPAEPVKV